MHKYLSWILVFVAAYICGKLVPTFGYGGIGMCFVFWVLGAGLCGAFHNQPIISAMAFCLVMSVVAGDIRLVELADGNMLLFLGISLFFAQFSHFTRPEEAQELLF